MKKVHNGFVFFLFFFLSLSLVAIGQQWVRVRLAQPDVQRFVQTKAREILKADVKIGKIRYAPPAGISLQEIEIGKPNQSADFSIIQLDQLTIGYGLLNFIRRDFSIPGFLTMRHPRIRFSFKGSSASILGPSLSFSEAVPTAFEIEGGEFHYPWGEQQKELVLQRVRLSARPDLSGRIRLELASEMAGIADGKIEVEGFTDPQFRHYELDVRLKDVNFLTESGIPLKKVQGKLRLSEKSIQITGLTSLFHEWEVQWKGQIENWRAKPKTSFEILQKKGKTPFRFSVQTDFETEKITGEALWVRRTYAFQGKVRHEGKRIMFPNLEFPDGYTGEGEINRSSGDYRLSFHRDRRRFQIHSNINRLEFHTEFQLDHASMGGLDWVVSGRTHIVPLPNKGNHRDQRFKGTIKTDYCIVQYEPLQDFQGSFDLDSEGIQDIDAGWGGVFHLSGGVLFKGGKPREDLVLRAEGFPLEKIKDFGGRPIPPNLTGVLEGKLKLRGALNRPEVQGYFTIKDGTLEKLDFDRAIIQFQGFPPYLKLYDSKIFRGRNTLKMLGVIDLKLENIFHGIRIKGPDSLVIWKGISASWKQGESAIEAEKPMGKKVAMGLEVGAGTSNYQGEEREESHAVLGPKVRF